MKGKRRVTRTFQCMPEIWEGFRRKCADLGVSASSTLERFAEAWIEERAIIIARPTSDKEEKE